MRIQKRNAQAGKIHCFQSVRFLIDENIRTTGSFLLPNNSTSVNLQKVRSEGPAHICVKVYKVKDNIPSFF